MNDRKKLESELKILEKAGLTVEIHDGVKRLGDKQLFKGSYYTVVLQPNITPADQPRRHLICIDGTWNEPGSRTNVDRFAAALLNQNDKPHNQLVRYYNGVGVRLNQGPSYAMRDDWRLMYASAAKRWKWMPESWREWCRKQADKIDPTFTNTKAGGGLGIGLNKICRRAYFDLVANYRSNDEIFIFGFSRGATIARLLANRISENGIPDKLAATFKNSKTEYDEIDREFEIEPSEAYPPIKMLGVWDTVASWVIPGEHDIHAFKLDLTIGEKVELAYHLVAIDERRKAFEPTLMKKRDKVHEIWFPGVHTNVGGGYTLPDKPNDHDYGLSDITLQFMINRAEEQGVKFDRSRINPRLKLNVTSSNQPSDWKLSHGDRVIRIEPTGSGLPRIHKSVKERMDADPSYQPQPFLKLGEEYQLEQRD